MQVFLSWSGQVSHKVATALAKWLPLVVHSLRMVVSDDIGKDAPWFEALRTAMGTAGFGIVCLTHDNVEAPWLNFESGALASSSRLALFMLDVTPADIGTGPLSHYQSTLFQKEDVRRLTRHINDLTRPPRLDHERLNIVFEALWPILEKELSAIGSTGQFAPPRYPIGGDSPFKGPLRAIPPTTLDQFYEGARHNLDLLGHSFTGLLAGGGRNALLSALANGATVRLIYLDPTQMYSDQIAQIGKRIEHDLREKIRESLIEAKVFQDNLTAELRKHLPGLTDTEAKEARRRLQIAATKLISYAHIQRVDDVLLISQYSQSDDPGRQAPTNEITRVDDPSLFTFYEQEFERIWEESAPIEELLSPFGLHADRARILVHLSSIQQVYRSIKSKDNDKEPLPYPRMLIVLPNMSCSVVCRNCFTWRSKSMDRRTMSMPLFEAIVAQAQSMGSFCIELTGGGEPLDHPHAGDIVAALSKVAGLRTGLLTNGLALPNNPELADEAVGLDYVRVGFTEYLDDPRHNEEEREFREALELLGRKRMERNSSVRLGVKLLLTTLNAHKVTDRITELLDLKVAGSQQHVVDHIKLKSIRGDAELVPSGQLVRTVEHELALLKSRYGKRASDLQVDIKSAEVPGTYRCWINPIMTVIDPSGDVYLCCNFYESPEDERIGSLGPHGEGSFASFWGRDHHRATIERMSPARVCNSKLGCHCRLVHYQELVEPLVPYSDEVKMLGMPIFGGHDQML